MIESRDAEEIVKEIKINKLCNEFHTISTKCEGYCSNAPVVIHQPNNYWHASISVEKAKDFVLDMYNYSKTNQKIIFFTHKTNAT